MDKYSSYKPSGIEWLETIPENWKVSKLKYLGELFGGLTGKSGVDFNNDENPKNKPYIPYTNIFNNTYISQDHFHYVSIDEGESQNRVKKYDMFFLMSSETHKDLGKSCILIDDVDELYLNSFCKGYRINDKNIQPLFLNYQILGHLHREMISVEGKGFTRINLRQDKINDLVVFYPTLQEQEQIVNYLDEKTTIVDKLISTKQRKVELLKEHRTTLINQVITKGLNPNVKMKDSGLEWFSEIPIHWKLLKLWLIIKKSELGGNYSGSTENEGIPLMKMGNIDRGKIKLEKIEYVEDTYTDSHILKYGDFLFNTRNSIELVGKVCIWRNELEKSIYNSNILRIYFKDFINVEFMNYQFNTKSIIGVLKLISKGTTSVSAIYYKDLSDIELIVPPIQEQEQIVQYLDKQTKEIDDLVSMEQNKIELLKEFRQSLISEVVTGKIKVVL
jgi:type I restriction enzyme S subunit